MEIVKDYPGKGARRISKDLEIQGHQIPSEKVKKHLKKHNLNTKNDRKKAVESGEINKSIFEAKNDQCVDTFCEIQNKESSGSRPTHDLGPFPKKLLNYQLPASLQEEFFKYLEEKHPGENLLTNFDPDSAIAALCNERDGFSQTEGFDVRGADF